MPSVRLVAAVVVIVLWAASYLTSVTSHDWQGFEVTTPVMLLVATYLFASDFHHNGRNGHG